MHTAHGYQHLSEIDPDFRAALAESRRIDGASCGTMSARAIAALTNTEATKP